MQHRHQFCSWTTRSLAHHNNFPAVSTRCLPSIYVLCHPASSLDTAGAARTHHGFASTNLKECGPPDTSPHHKPLCIVWLSLSVILRCAQQQHLPNNARLGEQFWHTVCQVGRSCASTALKASHCTSGTNVSCHGKQGHEEGSLTLRPRLDTTEASQRGSSDGICKQRNRPPKLKNSLSRRIGDFTQHKMRYSILSTYYTREACKPPGPPIYNWIAGTVTHYKPYYGRSQKRFTTRPYEPAMIIPSRTETRSLTI
jgi:hypothetical protein